MAKKRKAGKSSAPKDPGYVDPKDGKLGVIRTYEDVADSEDEFHINRDKILLADGPELKRQRKWAEEDAMLEQSEEEILAYDEPESDDEPAQPAKSKSTSKADAEEDEEEMGDWGSSRRDYYDADKIETEADALEEEAEAKRIQQKKLQKMSDADFGFDESEWADVQEDEDEGDVVTEVLKDVEVTDDTSTDDRLRLLRGRYPEFDFLADEYIKLEELFKELNSQPGSPLLEIQKRAVAAYIGTLTMYFAILTSPAKSGEKALALSPMELRDHPVMDTLLQTRQLWHRVKDLNPPKPTLQDSEEQISDDDEIAVPSDSDSDSDMQVISKKAPVSAAAKRREAKIKQAEADLADLDDLLSARSQKAKAVKQAVPASDSSDFGEEDALDAHTAAEKARRKKSLRFYTSQIVQKANRRAGAGRDAGGDADLPYRERHKDRMARLQAEAERRGQRGGADLGGSDDDDDDDDDAAPPARAADDTLDADEAYYALIAGASARKKADKQDARVAAQAAARAAALDRVPDFEGGDDDDGKRAIGYTIEKNKGLAPRRKKEVRNPRLKKRMAYEAKQKKLRSMKPVYKGGEGRGYGGELTGIKTGLVRSVKL